MEKNQNDDDQARNAASSIGDLFDGDIVGIEFFNEILKKFEDFHNASWKKRSVPNADDVRFIIEKVLGSLNKPNAEHFFNCRIDSYLYTCGRVKRLVEIISHTSENITELQSKSDDLKRKIIIFATKIFRDSKGNQPNLIIDDSGFIAEMNLVSYLDSLTEITDKTIHSFFWISKWLLTLSNFDSHSLNWASIISRVTIFKISLEKFIENYHHCETEFIVARLDINGFLQLIRRDEFSKKNLLLADLLEFSKVLRICDEFLSEFLSDFEKKVSVGDYKVEDVSDFLHQISQCAEEYFFEYLNVFGRKTRTVMHLWMISRALAEKTPFYESIQYQIKDHLIFHNSQLTIPMFLKCTEQIDKCVKTVTAAQKRMKIETFYLAILNDFIQRSLRDRLSENQTKDIKKLLNILFRYSTAKDSIESETSFILTIQSLIFMKQEYAYESMKQLLIIVHRLHDVNANILNKIEPDKIVPDAFIENHVAIYFPKSFIDGLPKKSYDELCKECQRNRILSYIWDRAIQLSFKHFNYRNHFECLIQLNNWMKIVGHTNYNENDICTIILVQHLFNEIISNYERPLELPRLDCIVSFMLGIGQPSETGITEHRINEYISHRQREIVDILQLQVPALVYKKYSLETIMDSLVSTINLQTVINRNPSLTDGFPTVPEALIAIIEQPPSKINIQGSKMNADGFRVFRQNIYEWIEWSQTSIKTLVYILTWMSEHSSSELDIYVEIKRFGENTRATPLHTKAMLERCFTFLENFDDIQRLYYLINCTIFFQVLNRAEIDQSKSSMSIIEDLKGFGRKYFVKVPARSTIVESIDINAGSEIHWLIATEKIEISLQISFIPVGHSHSHVSFFKNNRVSLEKHPLTGSFKTPLPGQLHISIENRELFKGKLVWFQVEQLSLVRTYIINELFRIFYLKRAAQHLGLSTILKEIFRFIDALLDGNLTLEQMDDLKITLTSEQIKLHDEIRMLLLSKDPTNNTVESEEENKKIADICNWLENYRCYSYIGKMRTSFQLFPILPEGITTDTVMELGNSIQKNCPLKEIPSTYRVFTEQFKKLNSQHLQLIQVLSEYPNVILMMRRADLYTDQGRRKFQELRDTLTAQFQLQERNNIVLNAWISIYDICEPFVLQFQNFDNFIEKLSVLNNFGSDVLENLQIVNSNLQLIGLWLSTADSTTLDNVILTMQHLYQTGIVHIHLRRLISEESRLECSYSIDRLKTIENDGECLKFNLSKSDFDEYRLQLTFSTVDIPESMIVRKILAEKQLILLMIIDKIYLKMIQLETSGHPHYQATHRMFPLFDTTGELREILNQLNSDGNYDAELVRNILNRCIQEFESVLKKLEEDQCDWLKILDDCRSKVSVMQLFSNRQIMILLILLTKSDDKNQTKRDFLKTLDYTTETNRMDDKQQELLTIKCFQHYLKSICTSCQDVSSRSIRRCYAKHRIDQHSDINQALEILSRFVNESFEYNPKNFERGISHYQNQQYLVTSSTKESINQTETYLDVNTFSMMIHIFHDYVPSSFQILWCSQVCEEDIRLFFKRIQTFHDKKFILMEIDKLNNRLREVLFNEQYTLQCSSEKYGEVYYFSRELKSIRGLRTYSFAEQFPSDASHRTIEKILGDDKRKSPQLHVICGKSSVGKTHRINQQYSTTSRLSVSVARQVNLVSLINSLITFDIKQKDGDQRIVYFNISIDTPFEELNRLLYSLLICGSLMDPVSGLTFSFNRENPWLFIIEVPYSNKMEGDVNEQFLRFLPIVAIVNGNRNEQINEHNYQLLIGQEEELVARILKAYSDKSINRRAIEHRNGTFEPVVFPKLTDPDECRRYIAEYMKATPIISNDKISEISFLKFLFRRVRFFEHEYYQHNMVKEGLGSQAIKQMIAEAKLLVNMNFTGQKFPRVFLVYDEDFSLQLLHNGWMHVSQELKEIFKEVKFQKGQEALTLIEKDPATREVFQNKNYIIVCLSWMLNIKYDDFEKVQNETNFILTENFAYKLFHIHERKLTKLPLIIEGHTGIGKTFLLKFYSLLMNTKVNTGSLDNTWTPRIRERLSVWLLESVIKYLDKEHQNIFSVVQKQWKTRFNNKTVLMRNLINHDYDNASLKYIWETIMDVTGQQSDVLMNHLIQLFFDYVKTQRESFPLMETSYQLNCLIDANMSKRTSQDCLKLFDEYLCHTKTKELFYRLLIHPGITEAKVVEFMEPICQLATTIPSIELVVFFDELNTSLCLGLFKEMFIDRTLRGQMLPTNIFFTAAINPLMKIESNQRSTHRQDYTVHELPEALERLKVIYGKFDSNTLKEYIVKKIDTFSSDQGVKSETFNRDRLTNSIVTAQDLLEQYFGENAVSQREIQRCFNLIDFFWNMKSKQGWNTLNSMHCVALALALTYYFRLPTQEDNKHRSDETTLTRERFEEVISEQIPGFRKIINAKLEGFVNKRNFIFPPGVAINQAVREHIFAIVVSIAAKIPLCIIGAPGQSKTLSFQIVIQNLQGARLSFTEFCRSLPAVDPFFCLGSKYTRPDDIEYAFQRAIQREHTYQKNRNQTRCVVFLDEASLPDEKQMVLKVLHTYLDESKVAFIAVANKWFDAANANRMSCVYRSMPSEIDLQILASGCLDLEYNRTGAQSESRLNKIVSGLCCGYRQLLKTNRYASIYHDRDFIYTLRTLRFETTKTLNEHETTVDRVTPQTLLRALEENFNGVSKHEFEQVTDIFFNAIKDKCPDFDKPSQHRNIHEVLEESLQLNSDQRRLYGRYKVIIDETDDESAIRLLVQNGIVNLDSDSTVVFRMSDFHDDINDEMRNVEILSRLKLCMESGKTILMINTSRIHGSLYDVFNQNFSLMAVGEQRRIWSKVAIGPKTMDVMVHEDFQCIVHVNLVDLKDHPAPFLSRFQKYSLSIEDFYRVQLEKLPKNEREMIIKVEEKLKSFVEYFGQQNIYGFKMNTLYSCFLNLIRKHPKENRYILNIDQQYNQISVNSKTMIEGNSLKRSQTILRTIIFKLLQLTTTESIVLNLPKFSDEFSSLICRNYFENQEHFSFEKFLQTLTTSSAVECIRKVMIFTRTSSEIIELNDRTKQSLFSSLNEEAKDLFNKRMKVIQISTIDSSTDLEKEFSDFEESLEKDLLVFFVDGKFKQQRSLIPFIRQLIDTSDAKCNANKKTCVKYYILIVHAPSQTIYYHPVFPAIFLNRWEIFFFDTLFSSKNFHMKTLMKILSSTNQSGTEENIEHLFGDFVELFEDSIWDLSSKLKISFHSTSKKHFENELIYRFYQQETTSFQRVRYFKKVLANCIDLKKEIIIKYQNYLSKKHNAHKQIYQLIHKISKEIVCGEQQNGFVDAIHFHARSSFQDYVSRFLKLLADDFGLNSLEQMRKLDWDYKGILSLIDSSLISNSEKDNLLSTSNQLFFNVITHYDFIPRTPFFNLLHQRIKFYRDQIKSRLLRNDDSQNQYSIEEFRYGFYEKISTDPAFEKIINESTVETFFYDLIRTNPGSVEKKFTENLKEFDRSTSFILRWIKLIDQQIFDKYRQDYRWHFSCFYANFEFDADNLFSIYSAFQAMDSLGSSTQEFFDKLVNCGNMSRCGIDEQFFRHMFDVLWKKLCELCSNNRLKNPWILSYTIISKYYSSNKFRNQQLVTIKDRIDFMNLAYLIMLNKDLSEGEKLVERLINQFSFLKRDPANDGFVQKSSLFASRFAEIIESINQYVQEKHLITSTLMIDVQQWILSILKINKQLYKEEILKLFSFLNSPACSMSWSIREFIFEELVNIYLGNLSNKTADDVWTRVELLPSLVGRASNVNDLKNYILPIHPSIRRRDENQSVLIDLFFFYLKRTINSVKPTSMLVTEILQKRSFLNQYPSQELMRIVEKIYGEIQRYFAIEQTALLFCQTQTLNDENKKTFDIFSSIFQEHLSMCKDGTKLSVGLEIFLSTIISKQSWDYLFDFLNSEFIQRSHRQWSLTLQQLLHRRTNSQKLSMMSLSQQVDFTLPFVTDETISPHLHEPFMQLKTILNQCVKTTGDDRWNSLIGWIDSKGGRDNSVQLNSTEVNVLLLLIVYYDYFCQNQLQTVSDLLMLFDNHLQMSVEENLVFHVLFQPKEHMVGYPANAEIETNTLNNLFTGQCQDEDELRIRHCLVNLISMILLGGQQSFLWTFAFEPQTLRDTFGFGSMRERPIRGVHYDCGCIINENGELIQFEGNENSNLNVPEIYVVYFSTFGALAWHLLINKQSVQHLHGPILAEDAIADQAPDVRQCGNDERTKVCHFVFARVLSSYLFLVLHLNHDNASMLINRCSEKLARLTLEQQTNVNKWIQSTYTSAAEKIRAENEYRSRIFFPIYRELQKCKANIDRWNLQSEIQNSLQNYVEKLPILVEYKHFKTELSNPVNDRLCISILRNFLNRMNFLKLTRWIYEMSQFYLLLHENFGFLVEQEELSDFTLSQLYERAKSTLSQNHQRFHKDYLLIIENGIRAVKEYHAVTNGQIGAGACNNQQYFSPITMETQIQYLVNTGNSDDPNIIFRILSNLVDYHNNLLKLLDNDFNENQHFLTNHSLKSLVNDVTSKEISLVQIAHGGAGVITLNDEDQLLIERLSCASSIENENDSIFTTLGSPLKFDLEYIQSYLIRTYLLVCRINYDHVSQTYQCFRRNYPLETHNKTICLHENYSKRMDRGQLESEFARLKNLTFDQLSNDYKLIRRIIISITSDERDLSNLTVKEYVDQETNDSELKELVKTCEIEVIQLSYLNEMEQNFTQLLENFQNSFVNVPNILRTPMSDELNQQLKLAFQENLFSVDRDDNLDRYREAIKQIDNLLDELFSIEKELCQNSHQPIKLICEALVIENMYLYLIPEVACEHFVSFGNLMIKIRSIIQQKLINLEESTKQRWFEEIDEMDGETENRYATYLETTFESQRNVSSDNVLLSLTTDRKIELQIFPLEPFTRSKFMDTQRIQTTDNDQQCVRVKIILPNESVEFDRIDRKEIRTCLRQTLDNNAFDENEYCVTSENLIGIDLSNENDRSLIENSREFHIVRKENLVRIKIQYENNCVEFFARNQCSFHQILHYSVTKFNIDSSLIEQKTFELRDSNDRRIDEQNLNDLVVVDEEKEKILNLRLVLNDASTSLYRIIYRIDQNDERSIVLRDGDPWKKLFDHFQTSIMNDSSEIGQYSYFILETNRFVNEMDCILFTRRLITINVFDQTSTMIVRFSYQNRSETFRVLKQMKIIQVLENDFHQQALQLTNDILNGCEIILTTNEQQTILDKYNQTFQEFFIHETVIPEFEMIIVIEFSPDFERNHPRKICLNKSDITIAEILQQINTEESICELLASNETKKVFDQTTKLNEICERKFLVVKQNQTKSIEITHHETPIQMNFICSATMLDVYNVVKLDREKNFLVYKNGIAPSINTPLYYFHSSPIKFIIDQKKLPSIRLTIEKHGEMKSIDLSTHGEIDIGQILSISREFWRLKSNLYQLSYKSNALTEDMQLFEALRFEKSFNVDEQNESATFILKLGSKTAYNFNFIYGTEKISIPCKTDTLITDLLEEVVERLDIPENERSTLVLFTGIDRTTRICLDQSVAQVRERWSAEIVTKKFLS